MDDTHRADASDPHGATLTQSTAIFIGDTANAKMTQGLTVNQGAADDEIIALKSSDIAHEITDFAETDTFGLCKKADGTLGGLNIEGYTEGGGAMFLLGYATSPDTQHNISATGIVHAWAFAKSGTGRGTVGADGNLFGVANNGSTKFIVDAEGNYFSDDTGSVYDGWDDRALVQAFDMRANFAKWRDENRDLLVRARIIAPDGKNGERGMVNWTNLMRLHNGALRNLYARLERAERALVAAGINPKLLTE